MAEEKIQTEKGEGDSGHHRSHRVESSRTTSARRVLSGVVISDKMDKTVVVAVTRYVRHPKYKKFTKKIKRYKVHDPENVFSEGDSVQITECRPHSKEKSFIVVENT